MDVVNSNYHSLEGKLTRRFEKGLNYSAAFTWSRSIDSSSGTRGSNLYPYNTYNLQQLRGVSDFNEKYRFVTNLVYELPFGTGKSLFNHGLAGAIVGGWQVGGILTARTGLPFNGPTRGYRGLGISLGIRKLHGKTCVPENRTPTHWWNAAAFDLTNPSLTYRVGSRQECARWDSGNA
jgi:hypothetical protein